MAPQAPAFSRVSISSGEEPDDTIKIRENERDPLHTEKEKETEADKFSWFENLHAKYAPSRKLKHLYFDEKVLVSAIFHITRLQHNSIITIFPFYCRQDTNLHSN